MPAVRLLFILLCLLLVSGRAAAQCLAVPTDHPLVSGSLTIVSGSVNNGTSTAAITGTGSDIQLNGVRTDASVTYPALSPSSFPGFSGADSTANPLPAGTYGVVTTPAKGSYTLSGGGSPTYIRTLNQGTADLVFTAGTYFIETWNIAARRPSISTTGGPVRIYIGQAVDSLSSTGGAVGFNAAGTVGDFQLYLYPNARFVTRPNTTFRGLLYSPGSASVSFDNNGRVEGVVATQGAASFGDSTDFMLTPEMQAELRVALGCAGPARFQITVLTSGSSCEAQPISITALDSAGMPLTSYTGTIELSTSTGRGTWSGGSPAPHGTLALGAANSGTASYVFSRLDKGVVNLGLSNSSAESLTVRVVDPQAPNSSTTSGLISFGDSAFVFTEDLSSRIAGANVAVAGRHHDLRVTLVRRASSVSCGTDTGYEGAKSLRIWRTDVEQGSNPWTAPSIVSPAVTVPGARPSSNNVTLNFTKGVADFQLATADIGRYALALEDSTSSSSTVIFGSLGPLTVRPFALVLRDIARGSSGNPGGAGPGDAVFTAAGEPFSATLGAYRWSGAADGDNDGLPDAAASLSQTIAAGLTGRFSGPITLAPLAGSQTPGTGVLGRLSGGRFSSFSGGEQTMSTLTYSEVGSFRLQTADALVNFLNTPGVNLRLTVFNASGAQNDRIGRFTPASFDVLVTPACGATPTWFSYSGQGFAVELVARNALPGRDATENYDGSFAKNVQLQAVGPVGAGTLSNGSVAASTFVDGFASIAAAAGPLYTYSAKLTAPSTLTLRALDTDGVSSAGQVEQGTLLRSGRLRLSSATGADRAPLNLPLQLQYWSGQAWVPNPDDTCTSLTPASVFLTGKTNAAATYTVGSVALTAGSGAVRFNAPTSTTGITAGSVDVALNLGASGSSQSCLASQGGSPAGVPWLRSQNGSCASSYDRDPAARATFGIYGAETRRQIHIRELR